MGLNSGPVFGPTFSPFWNALHCFLIHKTSAKQALPKSQFLSCQQPRQPQDAARGDNDSNNIVLTRNKTLLFPTLWRPLQHLAKNLNNFRTQKRACGRHRKFEQQTCQAFPKSWNETARAVKHTKNCCKSVWKIRNRNGTQTIEGTLKTDRKQTETTKTQEIQSTPHKLAGLQIRRKPAQNGTSN